MRSDKVRDNTVLAKRATKKLHHEGITDLVVQRGLWGLYLANPALRKQTSKCYRTESEVIAAAKGGERPYVPQEAT